MFSSKTKFSTSLISFLLLGLSCSSPNEKGNEKLAEKLAEKFTQTLMRSTYGTSAGNPQFTLDKWEYSAKTGYYMLDVSMSWDARCCFLHYVECRDSLNSEVHIHKTGKVFKQVFYNKNSCAMTHELANGAFGNLVDAYIIGDAVHQQLKAN